MAKKFTVISFVTITGSYRSSDAIRQQRDIAKMGARVKCGFRDAGSRQVPTCKVPREVRDALYYSQ